jgi:nucleoside 2-deoxyribosyltransferase
MKVYLAHNYAAKDYLRTEVLPLMHAHGHLVTSRWILDAGDQPDESEAQKDLDDIRDADALVLFAEQFGPIPGRGKYIELGYALALGLPASIVGGTSTNGCVFFALATHVPTLTSLFTLWDESNVPTFR